MAPPDAYNPNSIDAVLARMESRQVVNTEEIQSLKSDIAAIKEMLAGFKEDRSYGKGVLVAVSAGVSAIVTGIGLWFQSRN